ncbi:MAG: hypothetical protein LUD27_08895 [Clostridia bacterium]|nr:hypothetical protein [Clostridia bacterium]
MYGDLIYGDEQKYDFYEADLSVAEKIKRAISSLGCYYDDYIIVDLKDADNADGVVFFQVKHCSGFGKTNFYHIEVRINIKDGDGLNGHMYTLNADKKQTLALFDAICVQRQTPDTSLWKDITDEALGKEYELKEKREKEYNQFLNDYFCNHDGNADWVPQFKKTAMAAWEEYGGQYTDYITGDYEDYGKYEHIKKMYLQKDNDPILSYLMGEIEYNGYIDKPNYKKAFEYYSHSAKRGFLRAKYKIALMYKNGVYVEQNYNKYVKLIRYGYKEMIKERGENLTMLCAGYFPLELCRIEQESGDIENGLDIALKFYANARQYIDYIDLNDVIDVKKQLYALQPFDEPDPDLFDMLYVLQDPAKVKLVVHGKSYFLETIVVNGRKVTKFNDKYYRNAVTLFKNCKIAGMPVKNLYQYLDYAEVVSYGTN